PAPRRAASRERAAYERSWLLPGAGRHQVVDDMRGDENQQVTPLFRLGREAEQLSQNRQIYKKGDSGLCYRDLAHRKSANYRRFAIVDQDLVVSLLGLEREPDVHRRRLHAASLGG